MWGGVGGIEGEREREFARISLHVRHTLAELAFILFFYYYILLRWFTTTAVFTVTTTAVFTVTTTAVCTGLLCSQGYCSIHRALLLLQMGSLSSEIGPIRHQIALAPAPRSLRT